MSEGSVEVLLIVCKVFDYFQVISVVDQGKVTEKYGDRKAADWKIDTIKES